MESPENQAVQPVQEPGAEVVAPEHSYSWQASEYIFHQKPTWWYLVFWALVAVICAGLGIFQQWLSIAVVIVMALAVLIYSRKEPRVLNYTLDERGVSIDGKTTAYEAFHSYSVLEDTAWHTIDLEPAKRFVPRLTLICENDDVAVIESILSQYLPHVNRQPDWIERASRYLRF